MNQNRMKSDYKEQIILVGNPGVGKSTILNGLIGKLIFKSGLSYGTGMTQYLQIYEHSDGYIYADTPGLDDINRRKEAALEITKSLQRNGCFKIIFVVTVEAGRVKTADVTTMNLVLDSIDFPITYGVIINKCSAPFLKGLEIEENIEMITTSINTGKHKTFSFCFMPKDVEMDDYNDIVKELPTDIIKFIYSVRPVVISKENVKQIKVDDFEENQKQLEIQMNEYKIDAEKREKLLVESIECSKKVIEQHIQMNLDLQKKLGEKSLDNSSHPSSGMENVLIHFLESQKSQPKSTIEVVFENLTVNIIVKYPLIFNYN
eukprot:TRINITY_DN705_c0_g1_i2.p1 TRINITY_DN705_c0_g1~~TRINITY_DN705_c0_g1_i2.p1  ORF type:complete len:318 (-),score=95.26 TRINITY_DN705_c0_g1_i2:76-1029(-)